MIEVLEGSPFLGGYQPYREGQFTYPYSG